LVDVYDARFAVGAAVAVVQAQHVVPRGRAICKVDADRRIAPLLRPESAPKAPVDKTTSFHDR
jgi:hypothetical protein